MLAFMVVSAVGFSMYMRQSRAPSSYLRRNVASRYLVKAAIANAIEDLEGNYNTDEHWGSRPDPNGHEGYEYCLEDNAFYGIFDDPYPGCGSDNAYAGTDVRKNGDYWLKRVFCPFGPVGEPTSESDALDEEKQNPTVPTLTLEALAYLPPAIVDDVRKVSRLTRTACWRPLPNEAGRFAYTAVNVSDCFDINRLQVGPRDSGANRISLASLCSTDANDPLSIDSGKATALENAIDWTKASMGDVPWVSLADFALAKADTEYSPFTKFIGGTSGPLLSSGNAAEEANALFITDTWFPPTNAASGQVTYDLAGAHQPFKAGTFGAQGPAQSFLEVLLQKNTQDNAGEIFEKNLGIGLACLYDYLDRDSQPISLCLPTTEAVPMIVGVSVPVGLQLQVGPIGTPQTAPNYNVNGTLTDAEGNQTQGPGPVQRTYQQFGITSFGGPLQVKILSSYPFKRMGRNQRAKSYNVRALVRVWLAPDNLKCRLGTTTSLYPAYDGTWPTSAAAANGVASFVDDGGVTISAFASTDIQTMSAAIDDSKVLTFSSLNLEMPIGWTVKEEVGSPLPTGVTGFIPDPSQFKASYKSLAGMNGVATSLRPLDADGNVDSAWVNEASAAFSPTTPYAAGGGGFPEMSGLPGKEYKLYTAVWVQVLDGTEVVDMVPACIADDNQWLGANLPDNNEVNNMGGSGVPLLNFRSDAATILIDDTIDTTLATPPSYTVWKSLYAVDPRYNFAPEDWYATTDAQVDKSALMTKLETEYFGKDGRDRDLFMFVSDQEYLQDIGELQFLPFVQEMNGSGVFLTGDYSPNFNGDGFQARVNAGAGGTFANGGRFWRTYTAYDNGDGYDPIYALPYSGTVRFHSGVGQFRVNPYSDDDRVLYAALGGTPFDYYIASTNDDSSVKKKQNMNLQEMMSTYSFGESPVATLTTGVDGELFQIGDAISEVFQNAAKNGYADWEEAWNRHLMGTGGPNLWQPSGTGDKGDANKNFLGVSLSQPLHGVDRKFLASYWRECFQNRQQLFLIFVRAEPTSIGGGAAGSLTSAQLGARAVALVWRDPAKPTYNNASQRKRDDFRGGRPDPDDQKCEDFREMKRETPTHQTRILFYHQFD